MTLLDTSCKHHEPTRSLSSSSTHQLSVPHYNLTFGSRAFRFSAPIVWNSLPVSIRESQSLTTFRRHLKTFYLQSAYPLQLPALSRLSSSARPDSSKILAIYNSSNTHLYFVVKTAIQLQHR